MTDAGKLPLRTAEFMMMTNTFLACSEPTAAAIAGFAGRLYQLGYEHGEIAGKTEQAQQFVATFGTREERAAQAVWESNARALGRAISETMGRAVPGTDDEGGES